MASSTSTRPTGARRVPQDSPLAARPSWRQQLLDRLTLRGLPWRAVILQATGMWLATRIAFGLLTYFAITFSAHSHAVPIPPQEMLLAWQRKDVTWYLEISQYGYWRPSPATALRDHGQMPTAFFPLFPLLIHLGTLVFGSAHRLALAMAISNLGMLGAFIGVGLLAAHEDGESIAPHAVLMAAANPLAFFAVAAYTEGLFFALAAFALFAARQGAWRWAAIWAFLAGLTRFSAIVLVLPLLWEYGRQHGWFSLAWWRRWRPILPRGRELAGAALVGGAALFAIGLYAAYLQARFGDPLSFAHAAQTNWSHVSTAPWISLPRAASLFFGEPFWTFWQARLLIDLAPIALFGVVTLATARRSPASFTLYMLGLLYVSIATPVTWSPDIFVSAGRYLIPSVPIYLVLGRWAARYRWLDTLLLSAGFALQGLFTALWLTTNVGFI